jgi:hydroxymethylpyrimidine pyrophosphatase-like HAD family hydrolase
MESLQVKRASKHFLTLFSDLDGTLIHYRDQLDASIEIESDQEDSGRVNLIYDTTPRVVVPCRVLPTLTKGCGYLSERTVTLIDALRKHGVFVALLTGARSSTLYRRLPLLPVVDAIAWENGGRLMWRNESAYIEDCGWARQLEPWTGPHLCCTADECLIPREEDMESASTSKTLLTDARPPDAPLWKAALQLSESGWLLDTREYYTAFRVDIAASLRRGEINWLHNTGVSLNGIQDGAVTEQAMESAAREIQARVESLGLQTASNLGKADVFPPCSGKRNVAEYILKATGGSKEQSVALVDDDNDMELAQWCGAAYLPNVSHPRVRAEATQHPDWKLSGYRGPRATEEALMALLDQVAIPAEDTPRSHCTIAT